MIYLKENSTHVQIPCHQPHGNRSKCVGVRIRQGKDSYSLVDYGSYKLTKEYYYELEISNLPVSKGEYEYEVYDNSEVLESGLLVYGDLEIKEVKSINTPGTNIQLK